MRKNKPPAVPIPEAVIRGTERSALFWLMFENHADLSGRWKGRRISWPAVCTWAVEHQAWTAKGEPPNPATAKKTWQRVCAAIAKEQAEKEAERQAKQRPAVTPTPRKAGLPPMAAVHSRPAGAEPRMPQGGPTHSRPIGAQPETSDEVRARVEKDIAATREDLKRRT